MSDKKNAFCLFLILTFSSFALAQQEKVRGFLTSDTEISHLQVECRAAEGQPKDVLKASLIECEFKEKRIAKMSPYKYQPMNEELYVEKKISTKDCKKIESEFKNFISTAEPGLKTDYQKKEFITFQELCKCKGKECFEKVANRHEETKHQDCKLSTNDFALTFKRQSGGIYANIPPSSANESLSCGRQFYATIKIEKNYLTTYTQKTWYTDKKTKDILHDCKDMKDWDSSYSWNSIDMPYKVDCKNIGF